MVAETRGGVENRSRQASPLFKNHGLFFFVMSEAGFSILLALL